MFQRGRLWVSQLDVGMVIFICQRNFVLEGLTPLVSNNGHVASQWFILGKSWKGVPKCDRKGVSCKYLENAKGVVYSTILPLFWTVSPLGRFYALKAFPLLM